ncbi:DNA gyrase inhibitor YacG [Ramlibacter henchirensis]|uniref:DNA gyrase inhibitor YacG n=1 Tax=Ramlibacter henchirensis TaxID=204072 RepID=A0A4Z0C4D2_9BURK|nr:DNA gyrase inhibitor YacG [Ramlibacter henchirensis]TFZ05330.1 DNA gyrase inhibitor YacG [Ramlibacter henchirensis]
MQEGGKRKARVVTCPQCGGESLYAPENRWRPFCSERCKNLDLGAWASESFRVPDDSPPDDQPFGDPKVQ